MNPRLWFLALVIAGHGGSAPAQAPQYLGAGSCSASACHNANFARGLAGSEYTLWVTRDPHARAYESLFNERSRRIQHNLARKADAHDDQRCLRCHVAPDYEADRMSLAPPHFKTDGVSCESCHGPARDWLAPHHRADWRSRTGAEKKLLGMRDTQSLVGRVRTCVPCHVGASGMEVDHDLIAAGHPRLHFEFAAFHAHWPRHWPDAKDRDRGRGDFEARAWAIGQLAATQASLTLLADRAADRARPWPEFAGHDCAACHHDLRGSAAAGKKRLAVPWSNQTAFVPLILDAITERGDARRKRLALEFAGLRQEMNGAIRPDRLTVSRRARDAAGLLAPWVATLPSKSIAPWIGPWRDAMLAMKPHHRDEAIQRHLALAALEQSRADLRLALPATAREALVNVARTRDHATDGETAAIRARLEILKKLSASQEP